MKLIYSYIRALHACIATQLYHLNTFIFSCYSSAAHRRTRMFLATGILPVAFFCFLSGAFGQTGGDGNGHSSVTEVGEVKPLRVGDKVPEEFWTREHLFYINGDTVRRSLEEYRGKLLLLDFWATWCSACIQNMPKVDSLFRNNTESKIVYVTTDDFDKVDLFRRNNILTSGTDMEIILGDRMLRNYFPHSFIPHYTIIRENGVVAVQVNELEMNSALIRSLTDSVSLTVDNEYTTDGKIQPLFLANRYGKSSNYHYSFFRSGQAPIFGGANIKRRSDNGLYSLTVANVPLKTLVVELGKIYADMFCLKFTSDFIRVDTDIEKQYLTYEFAVPLGEEGTFFNSLLEDVSRYIPIKITPAPRSQEVLAITSDAASSRGARTALARSVQTRLDSKWTVFDFTDSYRNKNLVVEGTDLEEISKSLRRMGYSLEKKTVMLPYIVIERRDDDANG